MNGIPMDRLPGASRLFLDYLQGAEPARAFYSADNWGESWQRQQPEGKRADIRAVSDELEKQNKRWGSGGPALANIARLRDGARAVVTGQQVGLFGGPIYALLKAATAVRRAREIGGVPIFWLATEDHDFAEIDHVTLPAKNGLCTLRIEAADGVGGEAGKIVPQSGSMQAALAEASEILGTGASLLLECYAARTGLGEAFARLIARVFTVNGLIVMDAGGRDMHRLAEPVLRAAIERASALQSALIERSERLVAAGYHAQVLATESSSLLFFIGDDGKRRALKYSRERDEFSADGQRYSKDGLLAILDSTPERLSPNALLRPVMQDFILPTAAYVGGPAEVAYFAQSEVLYRGILGRATPILPRLSATLIEPHVRRALARHALTLDDIWKPAKELELQIAGSALPDSAKVQLKNAAAALEHALEAVLAGTNSSDEGLAHAARVSASKMRYQMERIERLISRSALERDKRLRDHAQLLSDNLFPNGHLQEREIGWIYFWARHGQDLIDKLIDAAGDCSTHHEILL